MSRHRIVRKINVAEELEEDDDFDFYGKSCDEDNDAPLSPGTSQFIYNRPTFPEPIDNSRRNEVILEEAGAEEHWQEYNYEDYADHDEMFQLDDVVQKAKSKKSPAKSLKTTAEKAKQKNPPKIPLHQNVESLKIAETKPSRNNSKSPVRTGSSSNKPSNLEVALASTPNYKKRQRPSDSKKSINLVIVGHVDAGKSTMVGHLLYLLGNVDEKILHRYRQESARMGKSSFAFAWILDEAEEERTRGVTMDIAFVHFESNTKRFNILDAPGHKDFIPNMITGASQADAALLVVNATKGEFETGFDQGGQTREHALLLRSLGVSQVIVAVNKLDTVDWSRERFEEICQTLTTFLQRQAGFESVAFVPVSGLLGTNLVCQPENAHQLASWYVGPSLIEALDSLSLPVQLEEQTLRIVVNDVLKCTPTSLSLTAKVETGFVEAGDKLFIMPEANPVVVKSLSQDESSTSQVAYAGDQVQLTLTGSFEPDSVYPGHVLCRGGLELVVPVRKFLAKIVTFEIKMPILKGTRAELFAHSLRVPCVVTQLKTTINRVTKEVERNNPRILPKNTSALIEIQTESLVNIESYAKCKVMGRVTLRANGQTIAAGIVEEIL